jgi:hypothetical protein
LAGDVRRVADQDADAAAQRPRQRAEQVALVDVAAGRLDVAPGARDRGRVDVGGVQLGRSCGPSRGIAERDGDRQAKRAGAAAQVDDHRVRLVSQRDRGLDEELAAAPRHEHPGFHEDPQPAELRPADHQLERQAAGPPFDERVELGRAARGGREQPGLVFGEDAPGGAQPPHDGRIGIGSHTADYACGRVVAVTRINRRRRAWHRRQWP